MTSRSVKPRGGGLVFNLGGLGFATINLLTTDNDDWWFFGAALWAALSAFGIAWWVWDYLRFKSSQDG